MRIAYIGNHGPDFSTESMWDRAFERLGHTVGRIPQTAAWENPGEEMNAIIAWKPDVLLYSRTHDHTALTSQWSTFWMYCEESHGIKTCALHADLFFGLEEEREGLIRNGDPLFTMGLVCTADGGHDDLFKELGVNHYWAPPCIDLDNVRRGTWREEFACDVVFVGSGGYHPMYPERPAMLQAAKDKWGDRFKHFGNDGIKVVRGPELCDVIASAKVVIGDSCFALNPDKVVDNYWSDRVPETLGRGGAMVHAFTSGLSEQFSVDGRLDRIGINQSYNSIEKLFENVNILLENPDYRAELSGNGLKVVQQHHTFDARALQIFRKLGL